MRRREQSFRDVALATEDEPVDAAHRGVEIAAHLEAVIIYEVVEQFLRRLELCRRLHEDIIPRCRYRRPLTEAKKLYARGNRNRKPIMFIAGIKVHANLRTEEATR
jgi:hypothetical protein